MKQRNVIFKNQINRKISLNDFFSLDFSVKKITCDQELKIKNFLDCVAYEINNGQLLDVFKYQIHSSLKKSKYSEDEWIIAILDFYDYLRIENKNNSSFLKSIAFIYSCEEFYFAENPTTKLTELVKKMIEGYGFN